MVEWVKWSFFAGAVVALVILVLFVTGVFSKNCAPGDIYNDHVKRCITECPSGQTRYPLGADISECRQCPLDQVFDDIQNTCVAQGSKYYCDGRGNCTVSPQGQFESLTSCKARCANGCDKCTGKGCCGSGIAAGIPEFECCPRPDDTCCYGTGCCPKDYVCDPVQKRCINCVASHSCFAPFTDDMINSTLPMSPFVGRTTVG